MSNPSNSFNQVKNLLRKMDDSISSARTRRLSTDHPGPSQPQAQPSVPADPTRPVGNLKARPLGRPHDGVSNGSHTAFGT
jgi:hypothetical protein